MKTSWDFGGNSLPQFRSGSINLYEEPVWLAVCGWIIWNVVGHGCHLLHWAKFPKSIKVMREGHEYSLRDYYGDLGSVYHVHVFNPMFQWHYGHKQRRMIWVEVGYDRLRELFEARNPEYFVEAKGKGD